MLDKKAALAPSTAATAVPKAEPAATMVPTTIPTAATAAALEANNLGFECYSKSEFHDAIQHFSSAIGLDGTNHTYYYNRSNCYQQIESWTCAIADARKVSIISM